MKSFIAPGIAVLAFAFGGHAQAQLPSGNDINSAIPIYFGQSVSDLGDSNTAPQRVYSIALAKGQQITASLSVANTAAGSSLDVSLWLGSTMTLAGCGWNRCSGAVARNVVSNTHAVSFGYTASVSGVYYVLIGFGTVSVNYTLQVNSVGPVVPTALPTSAGCVSGQVDSMTYSLQLLTSGLPDSASIGGTQLCPTCGVKAPAYPQIVEKLENAMALNVPVSACYDAGGNIFQLTLKHS